MKTLIKTTIAALMLIASVHAEEIICAKADGDSFYRPVSPLAVDIAKSIKVKTCRSKRFKLIAAKLNKKIIERAMTAEEEKAFDNALVEKMDVTKFSGR